MDAFESNRWAVGVGPGGPTCSCCAKGCGQHTGKANMRRLNKKARARFKRDTYKIVVASQNEA